MIILAVFPSRPCGTVLVARNNLECPDLDALVVTEARVDGAPMFKRIQPRARGTAFQIKRRLSHIVVTLSDPAGISSL